MMHYTSMERILPINNILPNERFNDDIQQVCCSFLTKKENARMLANKAQYKYAVRTKLMPDVLKFDVCVKNAFTKTAHSASFYAYPFCDGLTSGYFGNDARCEDRRIFWYDSKQIIAHGAGCLTSALAVAVIYKHCLNCAWISIPGAFCITLGLYACAWSGFNGGLSYIGGVVVGAEFGATYLQLKPIGNLMNFSPKAIEASGAFVGSVLGGVMGFKAATSTNQYDLSKHFKVKKLKNLDTISIHLMAQSIANTAGALSATKAAFIWLTKFK